MNAGMTLYVDMVLPLTNFGDLYFRPPGAPEAGLHLPSLLVPHTQEGQARTLIEAKHCCGGMLESFPEHKQQQFLQMQPLLLLSLTEKQQPVGLCYGGLDLLADYVSKTSP